MPAGYTDNAIIFLEIQIKSLTEKSQGNKILTSIEKYGNAYFGAYIERLQHLDSRRLLRIEKRATLITISVQKNTIFII